MAMMVARVARGSAQAFPGLDRDREPVPGWRQRAGPAWVERARRVVGEVEVDDPRSGRRVAAEIGALGRVEHVATGPVGACCRWWRRGRAGTGRPRSPASRTATGCRAAGQRQAQRSRPGRTRASSAPLLGSASRAAARSPPPASSTISERSAAARRTASARAGTRRDPARAAVTADDPGTGARARRASASTPPAGSDAEIDRTSAYSSATRRRQSASQDDRSA